MSIQDKIGMRVRACREKLGMSVYDLTQKSGIDEKFINAVEKGEVIPALGVLSRLARALGMRVGTFTDDQFRPDPVVTRASEDATVKIHDSVVDLPGVTYRSLALGKTDRNMDPYRVDMEEGASETVQASEGEELLICLSGSVELVYGQQTVTLYAGDTAYYNNVVKHTFKAVGGPASLYRIFYMPL